MLRGPQMRRCREELLSRLGGGGVKVEVDGRVDAPLSGGGRAGKGLGTKDGTEKDIGR